MAKVKIKVSEQPIKKVEPIVKPKEEKTEMIHHGHIEPSEMMVKEIMIQFGLTQNEAVEYIKTHVSKNN